MKRQLFFAILMLAVLFMPFAGAAAATSQGQAIQEDSLVDVWVFEDVDLNGIYSAGDYGFTDAGVCILNKNTRVNSCVGTDAGDVWWEITEAGRFVGWVNASTLPAGYKLNSITCRYTRMDAEYKGCTYHPSTWQTKFKLPYGTRINIFYALTRSQ